MWRSTTSRLSKVIVRETYRQTDKQTRPKLYTTPLRGWSTMFLRKQLPPAKVDVSAIYTRASAYQQQRMQKLSLRLDWQLRTALALLQLAGCHTASGRMKWRAWCGLELIGRRRSATIGRRESGKRHRRYQYIHHFSGSFSSLLYA